MPSNSSAFESQFPKWILRDLLVVSTDLIRALWTISVLRVHGNPVRRFVKIFILHFARTATEVVGALSERNSAQLRYNRQFAVSHLHTECVPPLNEDASTCSGSNPIPQITSAFADKGEDNPHLAR
jgi:hypothetical protein